MHTLAEEASDLGCRIILFRPFEPRFAELASNTILPVLDAEWKTRVAELIDSIDIAVVDLSGFSVNVEWELRKSLKRLPPERVVLVVHKSNLHELGAHWAAVHEIYRAAVGREPGVIPVIPYAQWESPEFAFFIHERLKLV